MYDIDKSLTILRIYEAFMGVIICGIDFQTVSLTFVLYIIDIKVDSFSSKECPKLVVLQHKYIICKKSCTKKILHRLYATAK